MHSDADLLHISPIRLRYIGTHIGDRDFPAHTHNMWEMIYQRTGHVGTSNDEYIYQMNPGMILIHPPNVPHRDIANGPYTLYFLMFETSELHWPILAYDNMHLGIGRVCDALWTEWQSQSQHRDHMITLLINQLDILMQRAAIEQEHSQMEKVVAQVQRTIEENYRHSPSVDEMATEAGVSRSSLFSYFMKLRGQTPSDYLRTVRIRHAIALLKHSDLTLDSISEQCGFYSSSHMSRILKSELGLTPGQLRKVPNICD